MLPEQDLAGGEVGTEGGQAGGEQAQDEAQATLGNAAVIDMLNDKKLADAVSRLQQFAEETLSTRVSTLAPAMSPGDQRSSPLIANLNGVQSEGWGYWRGQNIEPVWDLTFEAMPEITHMGTSDGWFVDSQEVYVDMQGTITFDGGSFDAWGIASYRYSGKFDVYPGVGAVAQGGGWGLVGTNG